MPLATFHRNERLGEIVIDNPPQNLFSADLLADLDVAVDQAADSDIRALLLRAEGDDFSAGADISIFIGLDQARAAELETTVASLIAAIEDLPVPALAIIHGQCYAGALEVCLSCDLIWPAPSPTCRNEHAAGGQTNLSAGLRSSDAAGTTRPRECGAARFPMRSMTCR